MIVDLFSGDVCGITRATVQVSKYSEENGGSDSGTLYIVEVLFPDGKWNSAGHFRDLGEARAAAAIEAEARDAELLTESRWPNRKVGSDGGAA